MLQIVGKKDGAELQAAQAGATAVDFVVDGGVINVPEVDDDNGNCMRRGSGVME